MDTAGRDADERVARFDFLAVDDLLFIDDADREPRDVVFAVGVKPGHLRRFPADERAARLTAAFRHTRHDGCDCFGGKFARCEIIEEKEGFCALAHDVVHAHGDRIDADRIVLVCEEGVFELGTHAVGTRDQHRLLHLFAGDGIETAE